MIQKSKLECQRIFFHLSFYELDCSDGEQHLSSKGSWHFWITIFPREKKNEEKKDFR